MLPYYPKKEPAQEEEIKHTPENLLIWSIENSTPENVSNVNRSNLMTHEEFKELWDVAFPDELKILKENIAVIESGTNDMEALHLALDKILFIVEGIDQADWFADLNGFELILPYLRNSDSETRMAAAWIISYALQNNPKVQEKFHKRIGMEKILTTLQGENNEKAVKRKVGMVMSALRGFKPLKEEFYQLHGFNYIMDACENYPCLFARLTWFVSALLDEEDPIDKAQLNSINMKQYLLDHKAEIDDDELLDVVITRL